MSETIGSSQNTVGMLDAAGKELDGDDTAMQRLRGAHERIDSEDISDAGGRQQRGGDEIRSHKGTATRKTIQPESKPEIKRGISSLSDFIGGALEISNELMYHLQVLRLQCIQARSQAGQEFDGWHELGVVGITDIR